MQRSKDSAPEFVSGIEAYDLRIGAQGYGSMVLGYEIEGNCVSASRCMVLSVGSENVGCYRGLNHDGLGRPYWI